MKFTSVAEAVAAYSERGFRVIPLYGVDELGDCTCGNYACKARDHGKHEPPATDGQWKDGRTFTADDFPEVSNVAIAMGPWRAGRWLVALDLDGTANAGEFFPGLPRTLTQHTPRGAHLVFTVPEFTPLGNYVDVFRTKRAGFSLDIRYARGRIVVAPSRGSSGAYQWTDWRAPAPLPPNALDAILFERRKHNLPVAERWERGSKAP